MEKDRDAVLRELIDISMTGMIWIFTAVRSESGGCGGNLSSGCDGHCIPC